MLDHNKRHAYVPVTQGAGFTIAVAEEGTRGYFPLDNYPTVPTYDEAWKWADSCNTNLGLSHNDTVEIMASSSWNDHREHAR